jgi:hypothetical protein
MGTLAWGPSTFEFLASDCASQYATIDATIAKGASVLEGFCTGFVAASQTVIASQSLTGVTATPQNTVNSSPSYYPGCCGLNMGMSRLVV